MCSWKWSVIRIRKGIWPTKPLGQRVGPRTDSSMHRIRSLFMIANSPTLFRLCKNARHISNKCYKPRQCTLGLGRKSVAPGPRTLIDSGIAVNNSAVPCKIVPALQIHLHSLPAVLDIPLRQCRMGPPLALALPISDLIAVRLKVSVPKNQNIEAGDACRSDGRARMPENLKTSKFADLLGLKSATHHFKIRYTLWVHDVHVHHRNKSLSSSIVFGFYLCDPMTTTVEPPAEVVS